MVGRKHFLASTAYSKARPGQGSELLKLRRYGTIVRAIPVPPAACLSEGRILEHTAQPKAANMQALLQKRWIRARLALKLDVFPQCSQTTSLRPAALRQGTQQNRCLAREAVTLKRPPHCSQMESCGVDAARRHVMEQNRALRCCAVLVPFAGLVCPQISQLLPAKTLVRGIPCSRPPSAGGLALHSVLVGRQDSLEPRQKVGDADRTDMKPPKTPIIDACHANFRPGPRRMPTGHRLCR